ncbi:hypothetical protein GGS20DRAFT_89184 [Poronia punctata]|nr:hypothetical protein GGS20DRAFT_89184 [Poronia punctata]
MSQNSLRVGPCRSETGRKRYRLSDSANVRWEIPFEAPHPPPPPPPPPLIPVFLDFPPFVPNEDVPTGTTADNNFIIDPGLFNINSEASDLEANNSDPTDSAVDDSADENSEFDADDADADAGDFDESDDDDDDNNANDDEDEDIGMPKIATDRINLSALSQHHNIYAVAYADEIHIKRVRSCVSNRIPPWPDLVLKPPASLKGEIIGGYINPRFGHQINHLITGDLGDLEILLAAYDDGDVIAYYMFQIENQLLNKESGREAARLAPFFHQHVDKSAWGLAIHKKSRLIAVGTNNANVHVFAFALTKSSTAPDERDGCDAAERYPSQSILCWIKLANGIVERLPPALGAFAKEQRKNDEAQLLEPLTKKVTPERVEVNVPWPRQHDYQIILECGLGGSNIPSVAFSDDAEGEAKSVLAVDILEHLWVMDIWSLRGRPHRCDAGLYSHYYPGYPESKPVGWGVLALPKSSFMPMETFYDSLGLHTYEADYVYSEVCGYRIATTEAIKYVENNNVDHPLVRRGQQSRFMPDRSPMGMLRSDSWYDKDDSLSWKPTQDDVVGPKRRRTRRAPPPPRRKPGKDETILDNGFTVMRTYDRGIELVGDVDCVGIMMDHVVDQKPHRKVVPPMTREYQRLAYLVHVPELSLVVAGSGCGRVALITLTRPTSQQSPFGRGFKVEKILPTESEEDAELRPLCPLLGLAFGPVPTVGEDGPVLGGPRYRLILHYYDHSILSYEVYRNTVDKTLFSFMI